MTLLSIDRRQAAILSDRYLATVLGEPAALLMTLAQAPLLGAATAGVFANRANDTETTYFVICLSAFFLGAINSSREIVKERALFLRERMFNLDVGAYLASKLGVQGVLSAVSSALLVVVVAASVPLRVGLGWTLAITIATGLVGSAVGLLISAAVSSTDKAVALVPIVVIPQILFSDFMIGRGHLENWTGAAEKLMPVHWGYEALRELLQSERELGTIALALGVLALVLVLSALLAAERLSKARY
jgi:hypothetical protein